MKNLTFLSLMLCSLGLFAQQPFAPPGAKWYVGFSMWWDQPLENYSLYENLGDTLVNGLTFQKIGIAGNMYSVSLFHQDSGKVYYWSQFDSSLLLIYDFGVTTGDSVAFQFRGGYPEGDTVRGVVRQDTILNTANGPTRKIVCDLIVNYFWYDSTISRLDTVQYAYAERIGFLHEESTGFFWWSLVPLAPTAIIVGPEGTTPYLRCYQDDSLDYRSPYFDSFGNLPCDYRQPVSNELPAENALRLFPNPTSGHLTLALPPTTLAPNCHGRLLDVQGRQLRHFAFSNSQLDLDLRPLSAGIYLIEVFAGNRLLNRQKVILQP